MAELFPTKTRLELLRGIADGEVIGYPGFDYPDDYYWFGKGDGRKVTNRIDELMAAGWVEQGPKHLDTQGSTFHARLTPAGRKVLEEADRNG